VTNIKNELNLTPTIFQNIRKTASFQKLVGPVESSISHLKVD